MELFFDTETSDKFDFKTAIYTDEDFPWCVQLGAILAEKNIAYAEVNMIIKAGERKIAYEAENVHHISVKLSNKVGAEEQFACKIFLWLMTNSDLLICHNFSFDSQIIAAMLNRNGYYDAAEKLLYQRPSYCTMKGTTDYCKLPGRYGSYKWPKLQELHNKLFGEDFVGAHDAMFDIRATMKCYYKLVEEKWIS